MILHITVRFLDARFHGRGDGDEPEWPPSPLRLFQAIVAGAATGAAIPDATAKALRWLELQLPPAIHAPPARRGPAMLTYVPNNNSDSGQIIRTGKVIHASILLPDRPTVHYLWALPSADVEAVGYAKTIAAAARHIRCLGWGIDMAIGDGRVADAAPALEGLEAYEPARMPNVGGTTLRVPAAGSLNSLSRMHEHSRRRIRPDGTIYDQPGQPVCAIVAYGAAAPRRPFCAFELRRIDREDDLASVPPHRIKRLVGMLRGLLSARPVVDALGEDCVNHMLLGHGPDPNGPRLSILPALSVGHAHADGRVRRIILAEPYGGDGKVCGTLGQLLDGQVLTPDEPDASAEARLARLRPDDRYLRHWYVGESRQWATVSPVLLPGFDRRTDRRTGKARTQSAEQTVTRGLGLVSRALAHAGIGAACEIEISPVSWWPGVPHARGFVPRDKLGPSPRYHVKLTFERTFAGPLAAGRQRHMGLGVFARLDAFEAVASARVKAAATPGGSAEPH